MKLKLSIAIALLIATGIAADSQTIGPPASSGGCTGACTFTSLALGGATIGSNALAVTGTTLLTGVASNSIALAQDTSADGLVLTDPTAAVLNHQQFSPRLRLTGNGWQTNTSGSQVTDWIVENQTVQGAANPTSNFIISSQVNGGGYIPRVIINTPGVFSLGSGGFQVQNGTPASPNSNLIASNALYMNSGGGIYFTSGATAASGFDTAITRVSAGLLRIEDSGGTNLRDLTLRNITSSGAIINTGITTDVAHTDATICEDTTTHQFYSGSGTLGICLGTSGRQFKTDLVPMKAGLKEIATLDLWNYRYKPGWGDGGKRIQYGPTAQDVEKVLPDLVGHDEKGEAINYDSGALLLIALHAIQEQQVQIEELKKKVH